MKKQKIIPAVLGLPIRKNGRGEYEYLFTQRHSPNRPEVHHKWQLAGGGIEFGETPEQALEREFQEELSVSPEIIYPNAIVISHVWQSGDEEHTHAVQVLLMSFIVDIKDQQPVITDPDEETEAFDWFTYDEAMQLDFLPKTTTIIKRAHEIVQTL